MKQVFRDLRNSKQPVEPINKRFCKSLSICQGSFSVIQEIIMIDFFLCQFVQEFALVAVPVQDTD